MTTAIKKDGKRIAIIILASIIMSVNIKSFVNAGGLVPGGFNGLTILLQRVAREFFQLELPFSPINLTLNAIPALISFKMIGKKFTIYSGLMIVLVSFFTDLIPVKPMTYDVLLISIFGGIINGFAISLCLMSGATSGGTDFIAIFLSEKFHVDAWNYILIANVIMLGIVGYLFGWDKSLYSILFQYASTQIVSAMHLRYKRHTLFIITDYPEEIYNKISTSTKHSATIFKGTGCYQHEVRSMVYSVVSSDEVKYVVSQIRKTDPAAFINVIKTDQLDGRFYQRPAD